MDVIFGYLLYRTCGIWYILNRSKLSQLYMWILCELNKHWDILLEMFQEILICFNRKWSSDVHTLYYIRWKSTCIWMYMVFTHCVYRVSHPGSYQSDDDVPIVKSPRKRSRSFYGVEKRPSAVIKLILLVLSIGRIPIVVSIVLINSPHSCIHCVDIHYYSLN